MGGTGKKVLLCLDICAMFPLNSWFLRTIMIAFLPAHCINMLQSLWPSIINRMKTTYRKALVLKTTAALDKKKRTTFKSFVQALHLVTAAWNPVTSYTTVHCFSRARFNILDHNLNVEYDENDKDSQEVQKLTSVTLSQHICWVQNSYITQEMVRRGGRRFIKMWRGSNQVLHKCTVYSQI